MLLVFWKKFRQSGNIHYLGLILFCKEYACTPIYLLSLFLCAACFDIWRSVQRSSIFIFNTSEKSFIEGWNKL